VKINTICQNVETKRRKRGESCGGPKKRAPHRTDMPFPFTFTTKCRRKAQTPRSVYRCLAVTTVAAGIRQRTTVCERCSVLRTRPNLPYSPGEHCWGGQIRDVRARLENAPSRRKKKKRDTSVPPFSIIAFSCLWTYITNPPGTVVTFT